jgi:hypothetical protein
MPHFQRSGQTRHTFTIRPTDFFYSNVEAEEAPSGPAFILQALLWSSLPKYLQRLQLADCQITDSQIATLVRALDNHEAIEVSGQKIRILKIYLYRTRMTLLFYTTGCMKLFISFALFIIH